VTAGVETRVSGALAVADSVRRGCDHDVESVVQADAGRRVIEL
jgi:hypothetical protein